MVEFKGPGPDGSAGYTAEQGLKAVLGGENIDVMNRREGAMSPDKMRAYIEAAPHEKNVSYDDESRRFAKAVLFRADEDKSSYLKDSKKIADEVSKSGDYDLTGFMFGWATNAVRYVLSGNPEENPAIITIGG